jgi:ribose 5-phosphate isomerase A
MASKRAEIDPKKIAAERAVEKIRDGMTVGLGSGSTAFFAIQKIGEKVKAGLNIKAIASSLKSENLARELEIPLVAEEKIDSIDLAIDGADEVDQKANLIKGGGGSLWREKIIDFASKSFYVIIDESKLVTQLGKTPIPVEILPFGVELTLKHLQALGCEPVIRKINNKRFISDNGNMIVDCKFAPVDDPAWLDVKIKMIPGVMETGLFSSKIVTSVFVGFNTGEVKEIFP